MDQSNTWLFWLSCSAAGISLACAAYLAFAASQRSVARWQAPAAEARDQQWGTHPTHPRTTQPFSGDVWRYARPWLRLLGRSILPFLSWRLRAHLTRQAQSAGMDAAWDIAALAGLFAYSGASAAALGVLYSVWLTQTPADFSIRVACAVLVCASTMIWLVWHHIRLLAAKRRSTMLREFPFLLDLMTLCVEAGLNLHGALRQAALHGPTGPLRQELRLALNAMRTGHSRHQALGDMATRCDLPALALWVAAIHQADQLGMSLGPLLRAQAAQQRSDRFLRAETLAMQAPVRLLFPLVTCMFPCAFLVIGFPIATLLLQSLQ